MSMVKKTLHKILDRIPAMRNALWGLRLHTWYSRVSRKSRVKFFLENISHFHVSGLRKDKARQIAGLLARVDIVPVKSSVFFYSIDCFKTLQPRYRVLDNGPVDYAYIVSNSLAEGKLWLEGKGTSFAGTELRLIGAMEKYYQRVTQCEEVMEEYEAAVRAISSLFERPAITFFEGLQRILFFNQLLWQTGHRLNGLGHLDWILIDLYQADLQAGRLTIKEAKEFIKAFFRVLHENYWFKSSTLLGDTGQIIILGGLSEQGVYNCNELTYLFIEVSEELKLPDPKVLLRCSTRMPDDLLQKGLSCIATGIGTPLLSNDDTVIPAMISSGYEERDACHYATSACWEPMVPGCSFEQNNIATVNLAAPLVELLESEEFADVLSIEDVLGAYEKFLRRYLREILTRLSGLVFEEAPLISLLSETAMRRQKDITRGGSRYNNLGLTTAGMGTVVNSLLNLQELVFEKGELTLQEINRIRKGNFASEERFRKRLAGRMPCYGCDDEAVIRLTGHIMGIASGEFSKYETLLGGGFKLGLSSPAYITDAQRTRATLDGRRDGDPFNVHISANCPLPTSELISFAMHLDYSGNRLNGNVVDFMVAPAALWENLDKYVTLLRAAFRGGLYQLQMNVVSSATLIAARENPELFLGLVVRVWGFSAYFKDLPEEYKELLIRRAIESEKVA